MFLKKQNSNKLKIELKNNSNVICINQRVLEVYNQSPD